VNAQSENPNLANRLAFNQKGSHDITVQSTFQPITRAVFMCRSSVGEKFYTGLLKVNHRYLPESVDPFGQGRVTESEEVPID